MVHHVALQGGEPLVHKDLEQVIEGVAAIPNLLFIDIVTNGTMVPKDQLISTLSKNGVAIWVSDYGSFSPKSRSWHADVKHTASFMIVIHMLIDHGCPNPHLPSRQDKGRKHKRF